MTLPPLDEPSRGLLRMATAATVGDDEWLAWSAANRLEDLTPADAMLLAPIAARRIRRADSGGDDRLAGVGRHWWSRNNALLALVGSALTHLRESGATPAVTGPAAIGFVHAANLALRPVQRAEIAVDSRRTSSAFAVLGEESWGADRCAIAGLKDLVDGGELRDPFGHRLLLRWRTPTRSSLESTEINGIVLSVPDPADVLCDLLRRPDSWSPTAPLFWEADLALLLRSRPDLPAPATGWPGEGLESSARDRIARLYDLCSDELLRERLLALARVGSRRRRRRVPAIRDWRGVIAFLKKRWHSRGAADFALQVARRTARRMKIR